jgi:hypothetical protein
LGYWRAEGPQALILLRAAGPPACAHARARSRREGGGGAPPRVRARASSVSSGVADCRLPL